MPAMRPIQPPRTCVTLDQEFRRRRQLLADSKYRRSRFLAGAEIRCPDYVVYVVLGGPVSPSTRRVRSLIERITSLRFDAPRSEVPPKAEASPNTLHEIDDPATAQRHRRAGNAATRRAGDMYRWAGRRLDRVAERWHAARIALYDG